jgi:hypothetical protein
VEVIGTTLSDRLGVAVIIVGDAGWEGTVGQLQCDEEVFMNGILMERGKKLCFHDEDVMNFVNPKWSDYEWY